MRKKYIPSAFLIIFTVLAILAKKCPKLDFGVCHSACVMDLQYFSEKNFEQKFLKNFYLDFFFKIEKKIWATKIHILYLQYANHYESPLPTQDFMFLKWRFLPFFIVNWNMVGIFEVEIFGVLTF